MSDNKQQVQQRFFIAMILSMAVLLIWSYFFAPKPDQNANLNANVNANSSANSTTTTQTPEQSVNSPTPTPLVSTPDTTPNKVLTIKTPLYQVKLDSKGAVATSWVLLKNVSSKGERILFADGATKESSKPLELIPAKALTENPRQVPFLLTTEDANLNSVVNERNYQVSVSEEIIELNSSDSKQIDFVLKEGEVEITKSFKFYGDSYLNDLSIKATRNGQTIPNTKLAIGASIGDQGIKHHSYYHIEAEAVAFSGNEIHRYVPASIFDKKEDKARQVVNGEVDWAGVGDTYFGMAAVLPQKLSGLEYRVTRYERDVEPFYNGIIAWITRSQTIKETLHLTTAHLPFNADGSTIKVYTGSKDVFTLGDYDKNLKESLGRDVHLGDFINYSWYSWLRWILKPLAIGMVYALNTINAFTHNYGVAIIVFTLIFYSIFFPLRWYQSKSFKKASANAPKMQELQAKMKDLQKKGIPLDDPRMRELQMQQLKLTKDAIPIGGCLPLLLQMPLFVALYTAVTIALDFRQASFLWLPDLSAGDPWHILEFLFAGSMAGSMILTPTTPAITDEQKMQQKMMTYMMPAMMLWLMWGVSSGLLLYWFFGNIVSFAQQFVINRMIKKDEPPVKEIEVLPNTKTTNSKKGKK